MIDSDTVPEASHGGISPRKRRPGMTDFSLSTNPYGPPPFLEAALERARKEATQYPDRNPRDLGERIESELDLDAGEVLTAGSASELLRAAILAYGMNRSVLMPRFTYEEYARIATLGRSRIVRVPMPSYGLRAETLARMVSEESLVVFPNPGTPFAHYLGRKPLLTILAAVEKKHAIAVVDESYLPFVERGESAAGLSPSVVTVFSWSKALGIPGFPFGHATGHPAVLRGIRTQLLPWSVGPVARHVALAALEHEHWVTSTLKRVRSLQVEVRKRLHASTQANYFAIRCGSARKLTQQMFERGLVVRDLTALDLPGHVRFGVRTRYETLRLLEALEELVPNLRAA